MLKLLLVALEAFQVAFLWIHDWIPLGRLNDVAAVRSQATIQRLVAVTLVQAVPYSVGLFFSALYLRSTFPDWLDTYLWVSYGLLFIGEIQAWWVPYLFRPDPQRATSYRVMFGNTHSFLPQRNGIVPNTLHVLLHLATACTLLILFIQSFHI
jgi:hypothetical protein